MSTVAASSPINYCQLVPDDWTWYNEMCKHDSEMPTWDTSLQTLLEGNQKPLKGGEPLSIDSLKSFIMTALNINKTIVQDMLLIKDNIMKEKGASKKKKEKNKEIIVDVLGDEYMEMSLKMLEFLSELERFIMRARDSHSYITHVIQQYFKMEVDKRDAEHYKLIEDKLEKLKSSDTYEHSADTLQKKAEDLRSQYRSMLDKLKIEIQKLAKKEKKARFWKRIACTIFVCAAVGLIIATIVTAAIVTPPSAAAIGFIVPLAKAGYWAVNKLEETERQCKKMGEANKTRLGVTRAAINELDFIKSSIDSVITQIRSLLYKQNTGKDQDVAFSMNNIKDRLSEFLKKIEDLEKYVEICRNEFRKARGDVLDMQKN